MKLLIKLKKRSDQCQAEGEEEDLDEEWEEGDREEVDREEEAPEITVGEEVDTEDHQDKRRVDLNPPRGGMSNYLNNKMTICDQLNQLSLQWEREMRVKFPIFPVGGVLVVFCRVIQ